PRVDAALQQKPDMTPDRRRVDLQIRVAEHRRHGDVTALQLALLNPGAASHSLNSPAAKRYCSHHIVLVPGEPPGLPNSRFYWPELRAMRAGSAVCDLSIA